MPLSEYHVPDYFVDGHPVNNIHIDPRRIFPDLETVTSELFAGQTPHRPSIERYAEALERRDRLTPAVRESIEKVKAVQAETTAIVYIAGPLTGVSEELKARYGVVSGLLGRYEPVTANKPIAFFGYVPHLHGTDPIKHPDVTRDEVRDIDYLWARVVADCHVNFLEPTAHGNAIELGWAESSMIPSFNGNPADNRLSRLTLGMNNVPRLIEYQTFEEDGTGELELEFDELYTWIRTFPGRDPREFYFMSYKTLGKALLKVAQMGVEKAKVFPLSWWIHQPHMMAYMRNRDDPNYGQAGNIYGHGWSRGNDLTVLFQNGALEVIEGPRVSTDISFWLK